MTIRRLENLAVFLICFVVLFIAAPTTPIATDEPDWIFNSLYLEEFHPLRLASPAWDVQHDTLTQPPVARYMIGIGRVLGGYAVTDLADLKQFYEGEGYEVDRRLLWWARLPMVILSALSGMLVFNLLNRHISRVSAYVFIAFYLANPFLRETLTVALGEAPLLFFTVLALYPMTRLLQDWGDSMQSGVMKQRMLLWSLLIGALGGVAAATKLNGFLVTIAGIGLWFLLLVRPGGNKRLRLPMFIRGVAVTLLAGLVTMVLVNPFLYSDPLGRTGMMVAYRSMEMNWQAEMFPGGRMPGGLGRFTYFIEVVFSKYAALQFPFAWVITAALFIVGALVLGKRAWAWWREPRKSGFAIALLVLAAVVSLPTVFSLVIWGRYYLFPVLFASVLMAVGVGWLASRVVKSAPVPSTSAAERQL